VPEQGQALLVAIYGPTASGKSAVAAALAERLDGEVVSADSAVLYAGIPLLTAAPATPTHLVGVVPLGERVSVGSYQRLAQAAIAEILARGRLPILAGGSGLYLRAAIGPLALPPPPEPGARERFGRLYDELGGEGAHRLLAARDAAAAARLHPNDRRRVVRALELSEQGASLAPARAQLWSREQRHPTLLVGLELTREQLELRVRARLEQMVEAGVAAEARAAWGAPLSETARRVLGLEPFATLPLAEAIEATRVATLRLARYQQKWLRRLAADARLAADRHPGEIADEIVALARARERLPGR
jgi:tRNA dimethylallyltransferase